MENEVCPTKKTWHMDIKQFAIQSWVTKDLLRFQRILANNNILGHTIPQYVTHNVSKNHTQTTL